MDVLGKIVIKYSCKNMQYIFNLQKYANKTSQLFLLFVWGITLYINMSALTWFKLSCSVYGGRIHSARRVSGWLLNYFT